MRSSRTSRRCGARPSGAGSTRWAKVLHGLRLADADGRIAHDGWDDVARSSRGSRVRFHPPRQTLAELVLEGGDALLLTAGAR
jgi:hypothetical protein